MKILSIETSCDETALSLIDANGGLRKPHFKILKNLVASQIKIHQPFGGVVPNLAKREHLKNLPMLLGKIQPSIKSIDLIAVTVGPGLEPCLWTGIEFAKDLYKSVGRQASGVKLIGVNHLEGHLYSFLLNPKSCIPNPASLFPAIALIVSGGHTILLLMKNLTDWKKLGETRDDAAGEAFDKVARLLNLPYPGGPNLEKLANHGNSTSINFPRPMIYQKNYDFSFSGLKTAVLYYLKDNLKLKIFSQSEARGASGHGSERSEESERRKPASEHAGRASGSLEKKFLANVAASFQQAVIDVLVKKAISAAEMFKAKSILISGGVANNKALRQAFKKESKKNKINFFAPSLEFTTDNAAMTAAAAYFNHLKNKKSRLIAQSNLTI
ncbi:MAG: tRNA (adenosine(37)-N6)-threonylcarbamoyltransferase complex transferase subunit TsaD [Patescibacteria group bacterium]